MKLTKKLEAEIVRAYLTYWDAYLKGDMKTFASFLDDNLITYGTAGSEIFKSKKEAVNFYKATADQMTGKADFRKRKISAKAVGDTIVVNEQSDLYMLVDGAWIFYGHSRITAIFEQKGNTWKLVHQHASFPDSRTEEGEQIATKKIKKENLELREAVRRRTIELEGKNRELEIEAAMEKVRAVAMGMTKAEDMLSICKTISQQLAKLGVKEIRNVQTAIFYESKGAYMNYEFYTRHNKTIITETSYTNHKIHKAFATRMLKGKGQVYITHIKGPKVKDWINYQKTTNVFIDPYLNTASSLNYYWHSLGPVALGISTYAPLLKEELNLFQRFIKVFELAYQRYLDIEKAHAQAKEAQIEAALERIRARALAMHSSDEFTDVARVMREQMGKLGQQELETSAVHLYEEDADTIFSWRAFRLSSDLKSRINYGFFKIPKKSCAIAREFVQKFKSKATDYTIDVSGARQTEWYRILFKLAPEVQTAMKKSSTTREKRYYHFSKFSGGALLMVSSKEPSNDAIELQKRAAQVFDLAYRRFKDLQKAEAQAREAQIEAALERIRAASLAMQDSSALSEIIYKLYGELTKLDAQLDRCFIMIVNPDNKGITWWLAGKEGLLAENGFFIPMNQHPSHLMYLDHWKKRKKKWQYLFEGREKAAWDRFGFTKTELARLPDFVKKDMAAVRKIHLAGSSDQFGSLVTGSIEPLPEEQQEIISRFAIAFNQAYIRFLDLQKAEAQAKESQIQLALERVRARTMAMQKSEELPEAANLLFHQIQSLGMPAWSAGYCIWSDDKKNVTLWMSSEGVLQPPFKAPTTEDELFIQMRKGHEKGKSLHVVEMGGKKLEAHYTYMRTLPVVGEVLDSIIEAGHPLPTFQVMHYAYFSKGYLLFITYEPVPDAHEIFIRFANVFDQTYTRFLDLQKAEAQAREAQIQLALERIRARSLAMHHTSELQDVANILAQQLHTMGMDINGGVFITINKEVENDLPLWASAGAADYVQKAVAPFFDKPIFTHLRDAIKKGNNFFAETYSKKEKDEMFRHLFRYEPWKSTTAERKKELLSRKGGLTRAAVISRYTSIAVTNHNGKSFSDAENEVLKRFGNVFEQSYIRFLDLQKAEAQAREAKIEVAVERVRAKALAMHRSAEIHEVVRTLRHELFGLNLAGIAGATIILQQAESQVRFWDITDVETTGRYLWDIVFDIAEVDPRIYFKKLWDSDEQILAAEQDANDLKRTLSWIRPFGTETADEITILLEENNIQHVWHRAIKLADGILITDFTNEPPAETEAILLKTGAAFDLAYKRFLDLQKAEAQAREAEIELGLERVRARAMAMQKSEELKEAATVLYKELMSLHIGNLYNCGYVLIDEKDQLQHAWMTHSDGRIREAHTMPLLGDPIMDERFKQWKKGNKFFCQRLGGKQLRTHLAFVAGRSHSDSARGPSLPQFPDPAYFYCGNFPEGYLHVISTEELSKESELILSRFTTVFEQTYTRFLDLQKAEAQAREAQIEAALERVRSRSLAMHNSEELKEVIAVVFEKLKELNFNMESRAAIINIYTDGTKEFTEWITDPGQTYPTSFIIPDLPFDVLNHVWTAREKGADFTSRIIYKEEKNPFFTFLFEHTGYKHLPEEIKKGMLETEYYSYSIALGKNSGISLPDLSGRQMTESEIDILKRFAKVFDQAYTRFLDLQKAEAQAREAQIEAALERVRSKAMAMHNSQDLADTIGVFYKELHSFSITPRRCGVGLLNKENKSGELFTWNTTEQGESLELVGIIKMEGHPVLENVYNNWLSQIDYFPVLRGKEIKEYYKIIRPMIAFPDYNHDEVQYGYFFFFKEGGVYAWTQTQMQEDELQIYRRFTSVLSLTYKRYKDLQQAEALAEQARLDLIQIQTEKKKAEEALTELQSTQKQLIQSEKMASLGELTAGIAHEIQNPLNFVNNFSEVSKELLEEMKDAVEKGNVEDAKEIMSDVIQNLEKINHHGKRADGIVKGMLQHSRSSSGQKELTDINALCDEYLRLAYHGLRAKDKSFNAKFEADLDAAVGKINLLPQDMGRVVLNLINNAFYAVSERKKANEPGYEPTVTVSTLKKGNTVEIKVTDNGTGIPQKVLDKIFQPFFTTKPTGQGTGLGLSLSYDIVTKAHGGELTVETKEGEGTSFIIKLPV